MNIPSRYRLVACFGLTLLAVVASGCDTNGPGPSEGVFSGTWTRSDAQGGGESIRFGPDSDYELRRGGTVISAGTYATATLSGGSGRVEIRYAAERGSGLTSDEARLDGEDVLLLTTVTAGSEVRRYERSR